MRALASVLDAELSVIRTEGPALGGAVLAAQADGREVRIENDVTYAVSPEPALRRIYDEKYETYRRIYPAVSGIGLSR